MPANEGRRFLMRRRLPILLACSLLVALVPLAGAGAVKKRVACPTVKPPPVSFNEPIYIDRQRAGGEPVSVVAQDGSIVVSAHAGTTHIYKNPEALPGARDFAVGYFNQTLNWRSDDGGRTWQYIGVLGQREGPHTLTSTGFSDPDLTMDAGGRIYNVEIDLANDSVFSSVDDGQSFPFANPIPSPGDRPWVTGGEAEEVYLYVNSLPHALYRSTDGGLTFLPLPAPPATSKLVVDPLNPTAGLIGPAGSGSIVISDDKGQTWTTYDGGQLGSATQFFDQIGVDSAGNVYQAAAGGYNGSGDADLSDGQVTFGYFNRETEKWNKQGIIIPTPEGDALWPWIAAGDEGKVVVVWYQRLKDEPENFYIYAAYTHNAQGTVVRCSDGSEQFVEPQFTVVNASGRPIAAGQICLAGTACNAGTDFEASDRRLGDFFTVNFDTKGRLFIVSGDTMLENPLGGPKPVGNPIFISQKKGPPIIAKPIKTRETRCLWPVPTC
ncbi:MAG: hypothetical protein ACRDH6_02790 [Actinomycetota bacterium]